MKTYFGKLTNSQRIELVKLRSRNEKIIQGVEFLEEHEKTILNEPSDIELIEHSETEIYAKIFCSDIARPPEHWRTTIILKKLWLNELEYLINEGIIKP